MKEMWSIVTRKGQVTVPAEIRRELDLKEGDKVAFVMEDGEIRIVTGAGVVERTAGALKSHKAPLSAEELRVAAETAIAKEAVERSGE